MTIVSLNVFRISAIDDRNLHEIVTAYFRALLARKKHGSLSFERFYFQPSLLPLGDDFQYFPISCSLSPPIVFPISHLQVLDNLWLAFRGEKFVIFRAE